MNKLKIVLLSLTTSFVLWSCTPTNNEDNGSLLTDDTIDYDTTKINETTELNKAIKIFYNTPSPLEMATLLDNTNVSYYSEILSPLDNINQFGTSAEIALNIGVIGVDFSYARLFNQTQTSRQYLAAIKKMSQKLGIPSNLTSAAIENVENNITNSDSLVKIINDNYLKANDYLKENDRESTATLIILGGWIEALYIAINIYEKEGGREDILKRITVQKYSLNTLIELLSNNQNDPIVSKFLDKLLILKKIYDKIEFDFSNSDVEIDTINKIITLSGDNPEIKKADMEKISKIIKTLRSIIIKQ